MLKKKALGVIPEYIEEAYILNILKIGLSEAAYIKREVMIERTVLQVRLNLVLVGRICEIPHFIGVDFP